MTTELKNVSVLFVCTGNICRSPTAEGMFRKMVENSTLAGQVDIDSAGTHGYHVGSPPDARSIEHAAKRGIDITGLRGRQVGISDFERFDYILVADQPNMKFLHGICPTRLQHKLEYLLDYGSDEDKFEVPDPYTGDPDDFETALDLIKDGCEGLLEYFVDQRRSGLSSLAKKK